MKVVTYAKRKSGEPFIRQEHEIRKGRTGREELQYYTAMCLGLLRDGAILDYQVELVG